jgi:regulator of sigma E protease
MFASILVFLVVLSVLILIHEWGHFYMARRAGVLVEEFGFGLPPRIWGKKVGETIYSINALPFGGFVRLHGENYEEGITNSKRAFLYKNKRTRVGIIVAGVVMNFVLAIVAFSIVYSFSGIPKDTEKLKVVSISESSPAQSAGLVVGDIITFVDKEPIESVSEFVTLVNDRQGKNVRFEVLRMRGEETSEISLTIKPRESPPEGEGPLGVIITTTEIYYPPFWQRPFYGIYFGFKEAFFWGETILVGLGTIVFDLFKGVSPKDVAGPVGIFAVTSEAAKSGILTLINFVGILSVNLAILNIIPFPALDGGRLLFIGIESVIGRKVVPKVEGMIHAVGMIILLALILAITISDIRKLIINGGVEGFLKTLGR